MCSLHCVRVCSITLGVLQTVQVSNQENMYFGSATLKPSVSMMTLCGPPAHPAPRASKRSSISEFPAVPTPPARRKRGASRALKAATVALGRAGSFRRKQKPDTWV